ncbi:MAG: hypothetical protein LBQ05_02855 [Christensenellaceae bacterium]|jgi:hypothetical protein|nr:hypothetical protein [Christensenellaceae bacterium]
MKKLSKIDYDKVLGANKIPEPNKISKPDKVQVAQITGAVAGMLFVLGTATGLGITRMNALQNADNKFNETVAAYEENGVSAETLFRLEKSGLIEKLPECREKQILKLLVAGYTRAEIAEKALSGEIKLSPVSADITILPTEDKVINLLWGTIVGVVSGIITYLGAATAEVIYEKRKKLRKNLIKINKDKNNDTENGDDTKEDNEQENKDEQGTNAEHETEIERTM